MINNAFAHDDAFRGLNVHRVNFVRSAVIYFDNAESMQAALPTQLPDLGIEKFVDYTVHKDNTQFQNRTLRVTDIHLSLKKETINSDLFIAIPEIPTRFLSDTMVVRVCPSCVNLKIVPDLVATNT